MPHIDINRRKPATAVLILLLAGLLLAACGSSSSSSSSSNASASATSTGAGGGATGPRAGRFLALRECLQKNGITLPKRYPRNTTSARHGRLLRRWRRSAAAGGSHARAV